MDSIDEYFSTRKKLFEGGDGDIGAMGKLAREAVAAVEAKITQIIAFTVQMQSDDGPNAGWWGRKCTRCEEGAEWVLFGLKNMYGPHESDFRCKVAYMLIHPFSTKGNDEESATEIVSGSLRHFLLDLEEKLLRLSDADDGQKIIMIMVQRAIIDILCKDTDSPFYIVFRSAQGFDRK